jgi:hypothetical protein
MAIPDFSQQFLRTFIREISKLQFFYLEVIWGTPMRTMVTNAALYLAYNPSYGHS